eukprot:TRINITY_DN2235_c0_g1_i1.p1 TRINITY_DN2235_c0_g1~~TRINITY_DN2235_c0_g1_i1.p1  ORF type:complete len:161 (-),score=26.50 TRINITY_DN2235_c0_g1_i1:287-769(-)
MGLQVSRQVLDAANLILGGAVACQGLLNYSKLPEGAVIPLKFGLWGEVVSSMSVHSKAAYLFYPATTLLLALTPVFRSRATPGPVPAWVHDPKMYHSLIDLGTSSVMFATIAFLGVTTEQIPKIVDGRQSGLLPEWLTPGYLGVLGGLLGGSYILTRSLA